ncbi:hypothetical protein ACFSBZ_16960 [Amnibacterium flavum]|uniref:Uncharacterized protein n=1 Tax=Amnibacterium flavum TaxID=2173173 RepID=A0A2V1HKM2_9MICO|nr:hypothetical protein [Amnibacterium flavum]PVZ93186.1 hypothetical protein DDQ50_16820 [Amnibacterium flavum]
MATDDGGIAGTTPGDPFGGVTDIVNGISGAVNYWSDPWGNTFTALRDAAKSLSTELFPFLTSATLPDLTADWFIAAYRISFAAAVLVSIVLLFPQIIRTARGAQSGRELVSSIGLFFPLFLIGAMFGPAVGQLLVRFFHSLSTDVTSWGLTGSVQSTATAFQKMLDDADPVGMAGGVPIAAAAMLLVLIGLVLVLCILVVQLITLYFTGVLIPLGLVWIIDPRRRSYGLRLIGLWFGILAAHPLLFFMLGLAFSMMSASVDTFGNNFSLQSLVQLLVAVFAMFLAGLSPLLLMKFAPVIPVGSGGSSGVAMNAGNWGPKDSGDATSRYSPESQSGSSQPQTRPQSGPTSGDDSTSAGSGGGGGLSDAASKASSPAAGATKVAAPAAEGAAAGGTAEAVAGAGVAAGAAESATGVGAAVGIPTIIAAGAVYAGSKAVEVGQKAVEVAQEAGNQAADAMDDQGEPQ